MMGHTAKEICRSPPDRLHLEAIVHRQPDPHVINRIAWLNGTPVIVGEPIGLDVRDGPSIRQSVGAAKTLASNLTGMDVLALGGDESGMKARFSVTYT